MASELAIPDIPAPVKDFLPYLNQNSDKPIRDLLKPYRIYDSKLREVYAQARDHPVIQDPFLNVVPIFAGHEDTVTTHARNLEAESEGHQLKYVMPLSAENRRPHGSPAVQSSLRDFQSNFAVFSEGALADMNWDNVVAAGSSVVTPLMPVPEKYRGSKRALRKYYHEVIAPASDVDLFLYGMTEEEGFRKMEEIETKIRDAILSEVTVVRTKYAVTIASQYPTRHIQIVLRIYSSVSEILTGFDVDCACAAYTGNQVYVSPRALVSYMTQINEIDLSRRSPSYENRLSKYSRRGFEIYWPALDRSRIDPTIFERNFPRTVGLARLLVLERLPSITEREMYLQQRRAERGRPVVPTASSRKLMGNIKNDWEDEVAEWVDQEDVANYHTFTVPYGPKFNAKKIEKLLYTKDLLLNAEWNTPKGREVHLHRHPAFFGRVRDVVKDCCCECPPAITPEEKEVAKKEAEIYISGELKFIIDNPGRQQIGSFNPLTEDDWTEMAYVSNTTRLCHAIVTKDVEAVKEWLNEEGSDANQRDYTGRTPLHLAAMTSSPEVVQALVDHGARIVARIADGHTALHMAAARGDTAIIKILLDKSEENEEMELEKEDAKRKARLAEEKSAGGDDKDAKETKAEDQAESKPADAEDKDAKGAPQGDTSMDDFDEVGSNEGNTYTARSMITTSFANVESTTPKTATNVVPEDDESDPDFYDVNVLSWDSPCSPLHLAIVNGHLDAVKMLVSEYGADALLPIKLFDADTRDPVGTILTLVLALNHPGDRAATMTKLLLSLGATPAQSDKSQNTPIMFCVALCKQLLDVYMTSSKAAFQIAINHVAMSGTRWSPSAFTPLSLAVAIGDCDTTKKLLESGASPNIEYKKWSRSVKIHNADIPSDESYNRITDDLPTFEQNVVQPLVAAIESERPDMATLLIEQGADINALTVNGGRVKHREYERRWRNGEVVLDAVRNKIKGYQDWLKKPASKKQNSYVKDLGPDEYYLKGLDESTYHYWHINFRLRQSRSLEKHKVEEEMTQKRGLEIKIGRVEQIVAEYEDLEKLLLEKGAKDFYELNPSITKAKKDEEKEEEEEKKEEKYEVIKFSASKSGYGHVNARDDEYILLFEAAWNGDLDKIKEMTLGPWGPDGEADPLVISIFDHTYHSPFSIALLRGHENVASEIMKIAMQQYTPDEAGKNRYDLDLTGASTDDDDEDGTDPDSDEGGDDETIGSEDTEETGFNVRTKAVAQVGPDAFTIDIAGHQERVAQTSLSPLTVLNTDCSLYSNNSFDCDYDKLGSAGDGTLVKRGAAPYFETTALDSDDEDEVKSATETNERNNKPKGKKTQYCCLFTHALWSNNMKMFNFLLTVGSEIMKNPKIYAEEARRALADMSNGGTPQPLDKLTQVFVPHESVFHTAMFIGRVPFIARLAKLGGGLPLDALVARAQKRVDAADEKARQRSLETGVKAELSDKSKKRHQFYQGLMVYGKKRKDWAARGSNGATVKEDKLSTKQSLLLHSISCEDNASAAWALRSLGAYEENEADLEDLLGDDYDTVGGPDPRKLYLDFIHKHKKDGKLRVLSDPNVKIESLLGGWLDQDAALAIHSVVITRPRIGADKLLEYLLKRMPQHVDVRTSNGWTPLMLAFGLHRHRLAKILIKYDANQSLRDNEGRNLAHMAVYPPAGKVSPEQMKVWLNHDSHRKLFDLIDPLLRPSMFVERCMTKPGSLTPLQWLLACEFAPGVTAQMSGSNSYGRSCHCGTRMRDREMAKLAAIILEYSKGEELDMINGAGDGPLHAAVMHRLPETAAVFVSHRPALLNRENAIGRTPREIVDSTITSIQLTKMPLRYLIDRLSGGYARNIVNRYFDIMNMSAERLIELEKEDQKRKEKGDADDADTRSGQLGMYSDRETDKHLRWDPSNTFNTSHNLSLLRRLQEVFASVSEDDIGPRKLVTLHEANEVAKRLAAKTKADDTGKKADGEEKEKDNDEEEDEEEDDDDGDDERGGLADPEELARRRYRELRREGKMVLRSVEVDIPAVLQVSYRPDFE